MPNRSDLRAANEALRALLAHPAVRVVGPEPTPAPAETPPPTRKRRPASPPPVPPAETPPPPTPPSPQGDWIGTADVAAELGITRRAAWEMVRRLGIPTVKGVRATGRTARFLRADFQIARTRSMAPPPPRQPSRTAFTASPPITRPARSTGPIFEERMASLRQLKL